LKFSLEEKAGSERDFDSNLYRYPYKDPYRHFSATATGSPRFVSQIEACVRWIKEDFFAASADQAVEQICGLAGAYQKGNVLLALVSLLIGENYLELFDDSPAAYREQALAELKVRLHKGLKDAFWPGRYQFLEAEKVILDGAHNPHGAGALRASLRQQFRGPFIFLFCAFENKNAAEVLHNLLGENDLLIAFACPSERAMHSPEVLARLASEQGAEALIAPDFAAALALARQKQKLAAYSEYIVATGSFAAVREAWRHFKLDDI